MLFQGNMMVVFQGRSVENVLFLMGFLMKLFYGSVRKDEARMLPVRKLFPYSIRRFKESSNDHE